MAGDPTWEEAVAEFGAGIDVDGRLCWAWWRTDGKPGHHRCILSIAHQELHECCCGARISRVIPGQNA